MILSADLLDRQLTAIFTAWGMRPDQIADTVRVMLYADLSGIDSHGVSMMPAYHRIRAEGKLTMAAVVRVVRQTPVTALVDAGGGLGHAAGVFAMNLAVERCAGLGIAAVGVRNSNHYGAAGFYARMAAERGFIGIATTSSWKASIVPTFGSKPMFGTNPIAFAAPAGRNPPFVMDFATSTAAIGKFTLAHRAGKKIPEGWALGADGNPTTDPKVGLDLRLLTPLGGTREQGSHKGYGLAAMVDILSATLNGGSFAATREERYGKEARFNIGHFFLALNPAMFREDGEFIAEMDHMIDALRAVKPAEPGQPVLVHGDPEETARQERMTKGIPVANSLVEELREIARACNAPDLIGGRSRTGSA